MPIRRPRMLYDAETHGWAFFHLFCFGLCLRALHQSTGRRVDSSSDNRKCEQNVSLLMPFAFLRFFFSSKRSKGQSLPQLLWINVNLCWIILTDGNNGHEKSCNSANGDYLAYCQWITAHPFQCGTITPKSWNITSSSTRNIWTVFKSQQFLGSPSGDQRLGETADMVSVMKHHWTIWFPVGWLLCWICWCKVWITSWKTYFWSIFPRRNCFATVWSNWNLLDFNKQRWKTFYFSKDEIVEPLKHWQLNM